MSLVVLNLQIDIMSVANCDDKHKAEPDSNKSLLQTNTTSDGELPPAEEAESQPPRWRLKLVALLTSFVALGLSSSMNGPTLVDLEQVLHTDTKGMSISLSMHGAGYLMGAMLCGLTFDRFHMEMQLSLITFFVGAFTIVAPWTGSLAGYSVLLCLRATCSGFLDSSGQAYVLHVMRGHRLQDPALQLMHGLWSVGATVGPLIVQPFLSPRLPDGQEANTTSDLVISHNTSHPRNESYINATSGTSALAVSPTKVQFAFILLGSACVALSSVFWYIYVSGPKGCRTSKENDKAGVLRKQTKPRKIRIQLLTMLFCWFFSYVFVESIPGDFVATWVIKTLRWPKYTGPILTSSLWAALGAGRLLAVPVSAVLSPRLMLCISSGVTSLSFVVLLAFHPYHQAIVWVSIVTAGLGMSWAFGTTILWASRYIRVDGAAASVFLIGTSSASIIAPLLTGYLYQEHSPMWFLYIITGAAFLDLLLFISLEIFVRCLRLDERYVDVLEKDAATKHDKKEPVLEMGQLKKSD